MLVENNYFVERKIRRKYETIKTHQFDGLREMIKITQY